LVVLITLGLGLILSHAELEKLKIAESGFLDAGKEILLSALSTPLDHLRGLDQEPQVKQALGAPEARARLLMEQEFLTLLFRNPSYDQARWLNAAGWEIARVNNTPEGPRIVPESELQDKSVRHYYQQAIGLAPGRMYLSPLDLSVEHGEIEIPYRPMIRLAIRLPVVDGRDQGMLVIDMNAQPLLDHLRRLAPPGLERQAMLLNPQGYWLMAPDPGDAWGFMFGRDTRLGHRHPAEWASIQAQRLGQILTSSGLWIWTTVAPAVLKPEDLRVAEDWKLVSYISTQELWARHWHLWWPLLLIAASALVLLAIGVRRYLQVLGERERSQAELAMAKEQRLAAELDHMRLLMQEAETIAQLGAWEYEVATQGMTWSPGECRIYGLDPTAPSPDYGAMLRRCIHPDDAKRLDEVFSAALAAGAPFELEHRIQRPDGSERVVQDLAYPVRDDRGRLIRFVGATLDITERRQAEVQLAATTLHLHSLLEALPVAVAFTDGLDVGHIQANRTFRQWFEMTQDAEVSASAPDATAPGRQVRYFHAGQELEADTLPLQRALSEGRPTAALELEIALPSGRRWISEITAVPIRDAGGALIGALAVLVDITARKHAEEELSALNATLEQKVVGRTAELEAARDEVAQALERMARSEARFRIMFEQAPLGIALVDSLNGQIYAVNPRFAAIAGRSQEEITHIDWMSITHPDDIQPDLDNMARLNAGEIPGFQMNKRFLHPDGAVVWISLTIAPVTGEPGQGPRHLSMIEDITERLAAERRMQETLGLLQVARQVADIGIWTWDIANGALTWDERLWAWCEVPKETDPGKLDYAFWRGRLHPDDRGHAEEAIAVALRDQVPYEDVFRILPPSGQVRYLQSSALIERAAGGAPLRMIGVNRDITAQRELEEGLRAAKEAAEAANRAKSAFLAHMSHEIRTPLHAVLGLAQVLEKSTLAADQRAMVQQVRTAGGNLLGILNDVLDLSKIEAGRLGLVTQPFALAPLLGHLDSLLGPTARAKGLKLSIETSPSELTGGLLGDAPRLQQVLVNLLGNALKFTDQGEVRLGIATRELTADQTRLRFAVSDTGIGLTPEALARLFTPFTQADASITRRFGGTGLGLTISKRLVELMGGAIGAESRVGVGSTFWFELPFARTLAVEEQPLSSAAMTPAGPRLAGRHLLVVDDSPLNGEVVKRMLHLEGALATLAENGQQALDQLRAQPQGFDAVLMDVQMPIMDGLTATRQIRASLGLRDLPIIALTAGVMPEEQAAARAAGVNAVLPKPLELEDLVALLRQWLTPAAAEGISSLPTVGGGSGTRGAAPPAAFPEIPGIDRERAAHTLGQDRAFFLRLLGRFLAESAPLVVQAGEALAQGDRDSAGGYLHSLKGNAGSIGAMNLMTLAGQLERAIDQGAAVITTAEGELTLAAGLADLAGQVAALTAASAAWLAPPSGAPTVVAAGGSPTLASPLAGAPHAAAPLSATPLAATPLAAPLEGLGTTAAAPLVAPPPDLERLDALHQALRTQRFQARKLFEELAPVLEAFLGPARVQAMAADIASLRFGEALAVLEDSRLTSSATPAVQNEARR